MQRRQRNKELREEEHDKRIKTEAKYRDRAAERRTGREETNENEEEFPITEAKSQVSQLIAKQIAQMYTKPTVQGVVANQQKPQNDFTLSHADVELVKSINFSKKVPSLLHNEDDGEEFSKDVQDISSEEEDEEDNDFDMFALANKQSLDSLSKDELVAMLHRVEDAMALKMKMHHQ